MIVSASRAHAAVLAAIHSSAFPPSEAWDETTFAAQLDVPSTFALIEETGGFVLARAVADEAEILMLAVTPEARRMGIGTTLIAEAKRTAAAGGAVSMFLEVSADNVPAIRLYGSSGFRIVGRRPAYYRDGSDAIVMRAMLVAPGALRPS